MNETGIVTDIRGETAVVKVERQTTVGATCCVGVTAVKPFFLEARNLCHARVGDHVRVESDDDKAPFRSLAQAGLCIAAFVIGLGAAGAVFPLLGIAGHREPFSFGLGLVMAALSFGIARRVNRKKMRAPAACELLSL
jgi:hypothetical protein